MDGETTSIGNRVIDTDEFHIKRTQTDDLTRLNALEIRLVRGLQLLELVLNYSESQF